jgi:hypothetical protein
MTKKEQFEHDAEKIMSVAQLEAVMMIHSAIFEGPEDALLRAAGTAVMKDTVEKVVDGVKDAVNAAVSDAVSDTVDSADDKSDSPECQGDCVQKPCDGDAAELTEAMKGMSDEDIRGFLESLDPNDREILMEGVLGTVLKGMGKAAKFVRPAISKALPEIEKFGGKLKGDLASAFSALKNSPAFSKDARNANILDKFSKNTNELNILRQLNPTARTAKRMSELSKENEALSASINNTLANATRKGNTKAIDDLVASSARKNASSISPLLANKNLAAKQAAKDALMKEKTAALKDIDGQIAEKSQLLDINSGTAEEDEIKKELIALKTQRVGIESEWNKNNADAVSKLDEEIKEAGHFAGHQPNNVGVDATRATMNGNGGQAYPMNGQQSGDMNALLNASRGTMMNIGGNTYIRTKDGIKNIGLINNIISKVPFIGSINKARIATKTAYPILSKAVILGGIGAGGYYALKPNDASGEGSGIIENVAKAAAVIGAGYVGYKGAEALGCGSGGKTIGALAGSAVVAYLVWLNDGDEKKGNDMYNALSNLPLDQQAVASKALGIPNVQNSMLSAFNMNPSMLSSFAL